MALRGGSHPRSVKAAALGVGIALGTVLCFLLGVSSVSAHHVVCTVGKLIDEELLWTPLWIVDSPANGTAAVVATLGGFPTIPGHAANGTALGLFSLDQWQLFSQGSSSVAGPGSNSRCGPYIAIDATREIPGAWSLNDRVVQLLPNGSGSDAAIPQQVNLSVANGTVYGSVQFFAGFQSNNTTEIGVQPPGVYAGLNLKQSFIEVVLAGFRPAGGLSAVILPVSLAGNTTFNYTLEGPGCWRVSGYDQPNVFGTGLAFESVSRSWPC